MSNNNEDLVDEGKDKNRLEEKHSGKIDRVKSKRLLSKRFWFIYVVSGTVFVGLFFTVVLGVFGYWRSPAYWALWIITSGVILVTGYQSISKIVVKRLLAFLLICALLTMPLFTIFAVTYNQNIAQNLNTQSNISYFKNQLGRSYNYTELIVWENKHLNFTYADIEGKNDPIKIVEHGKGSCEEFATLYATLCISQGYRCRIVHNVFNDHVFNEVLEANGTWIRVDSSLNPTGTGAVGNPMFFEKTTGWGAPILSLAFENSTITEVTRTYRSDKFNLFSPIPVALLVAVFVVLLIAITKLLILPTKSVSCLPALAN